MLKQKINKHRLNQALKNQSEELDSISGLANEIFNSKDYQVFRNNFASQLSSSINTLINFSESEDDPVKFAMKVKPLLIKIKVLKDIIDKVDKENERFLRKGQ